jgi:hypothetical protein
MEHFDTKLKEFFVSLPNPAIFTPQNQIMNRRSIFLLEKQLLPMSQTIVQRDVLHHWHGANSMQYCNFLCLMCDFAAMFGLVFSLIPMLL